MRTIDYNSTDVTINFYFTNGQIPLTGIVYNTSGLACCYIRERSVPVTVTLTGVTVTGTHIDGGFVEISNNSVPGLYRVDLPDAVFTSGVNFSIVQFTGAEIATPPFEIPIVQNIADNILTKSNSIETSYSVRDAIRLILSSTSANLTGASGVGNTIYIRDINNTKNRITASVDSSGNRNSIIYDIT